MSDQATTLHASGPPNYYVGDEPVTVAINTLIDKTNDNTSKINHIIDALASMEARLTATINSNACRCDGNMGAAEHELKRDTLEMLNQHAMNRTVEPKQPKESQEK